MEMMLKEGFGHHPSVFRPHFGSVFLLNVAEEVGPLTELG
jgi:hypothetical protein